MTVQVALCTLSATAVVPTIVADYVVVVPDPASATASGVNPSVTAQGEGVPIPTMAFAASALVPEIITDAIIDVPAVAQASASAMIPIVQGDDVSIPVENTADASAEAVAPTIITDYVVVVPDPAEASAQAMNPNIILAGVIAPKISFTAMALAPVVTADTVTATVVVPAAARADATVNYAFIDIIADQIFTGTGAPTAQAIAIIPPVVTGNDPNATVIVLAAATSAASAIIPASVVGLGSADATVTVPAAATSAASAVDPDSVIGETPDATVVVPAAATAAASALSPTIAGEGVTIYPPTAFSAAMAMVPRVIGLGDRVLLFPDIRGQRYEHGPVYDVLSTPMTTAGDRRRARTWKPPLERYAIGWDFLTPGEAKEIDDAISNLNGSWRSVEFYEWLADDHDDVPITLIASGIGWASYSLNAKDVESVSVKVAGSTVSVTQLASGVGEFGSDVVYINVVPAPSQPVTATYYGRRRRKVRIATDGMQWRDTTPGDYRWSLSLELRQVSDPTLRPTG